jgi:integrase
MSEIEPRRRQRRKTLTDSMIAALPRRAGKTYYAPDPEMPKHGVRIRPVGPGTYTVITRNRYGQQKWIRIGSTAEMPIAEARNRARDVIRRVEAGHDPFEAPQAQPDSVAAVAENWLIRHVGKNKLRTAGEMRRIIERYIIPHIGQLAFVGVRRKQIAELLDHIQDKHGAAQADAVLAVLRSMATFTAARDENYEMPFVKNMKRVPKADRKRSRILNDVELQTVWRHAEGAGDYGALVRLLLLTAQRLDKVADLKWDDISSDGIWTIRTEQGEKGNAGALQLPSIALQIIAAQPRFVANPYVFAGQNGRRAFTSKNKVAFDQGCGVVGWRLHDLRRTARSLMSRANVLSEHAEKVMGHAIGGVEGVYDVYEYLPEKATALRALAALIERIVDPPADNVVPLHEAVRS